MSSSGVSIPCIVKTPDTNVDAEVLSPKARELMNSSPFSLFTEVTNPARDIHPLDKFPLFRKLPLELRRMIWWIALNRPQVVGVIFSLEYDRPDMTGWQYRPSTSRQPVIRFVNKEARKEALNLEFPLFTYLPFIKRPTILSTPAVDTVLLLEKEFACEFGLWQMLMDMVDEIYPTPKMKKIAVHIKWRPYFNGLGLEDLEANFDALKVLGTEEIVFVVGDEAGCRGKEVKLGEKLPVQDTKEILEADLVAKIKDELKMKTEDKITWQDLMEYDLRRIEYANEICEVDPKWTVTKISYCEVAARV